MSGLSLHIGLNSVNPTIYNGWNGDLVACENDAIAMRAIATSFGYQTQILLTEAATRDAVMRAIEEMAQEIGEEDLFLLTYSGHGGQVPDLNGDEPGGMDETWVLYDGEIVDDELHEMYTRFKPGTRVVVLSDCCHSGSVARLYERVVPIEAEMGLRPHATFRPKMIPRHFEDAHYSLHKKLFEEIQARTAHVVRKEPEATVLLMTACQDHQFATDGDMNGLFTEMLLKVWDNAHYAHGYRSFQRAIKKQMPPSQTPNYFVVGAPNRAFEEQRPFTVIVPTPAFV